MLNSGHKHRSCVSLLSWFCLFWLASAAAGARPKIIFDVPEAIECRDVTTPVFAKSSPEEKLIEANFHVSTRVTEGEEKEIASVEYQLTSPSKRFRVVDFLPNTRLEDLTVDGYIEIEERSSESLRAGGTAEARASVGYRLAQSSRKREWSD